MNLMTRKFVSDRLKISRRTCFNMLRSCRGSLTEVQVLKLLNDSAANVDPFTMIPSDLLTLKEAAATVTVNGEPLKVERLLSWINSPSNHVPHLRITSKCIRLPKSAFEAWAAVRFTGRKRGAA